MGEWGSHLHAWFSHKGTAKVMDTPKGWGPPGQKSTELGVPAALDTPTPHNAQQQIQVPLKAIMPLNSEPQDPNV